MNDEMLAEYREGHFPWDGNNMIEKRYRDSNYKVIVTKSQSANAIVFFSGNGLYFPNEEAVFADVICEKDRYEWENIAKLSLIQEHYAKIIFVRDIYKQWYVRGISSSVDSVTKVIELIQSLTQGYDIVTCGNSAGGYMAILVGKEIGAKKIFSFSGQFSCWNQIDSAPLIKYYSGNSNYNKWYDLKDLLRKGGGVFHFYPAQSAEDIEQIKLVETVPKVDFYVFSFLGDKHGVTVESSCYEYLLTMKKVKLIELSEKYKFSLIDANVCLKDILPYYKILENESEYIKHLFGGRNKFYIWGTGFWGNENYQMFKNLGLEIEGFVDTNKKQDTWHDYRVFLPEELKETGDDSMICISTEKYQNDIIRQLQEMGITSDRYCSFCQFREKILGCSKVRNCKMR